MATIAFIGSVPQKQPADRKKEQSSTAVIRRPTLKQGLALEKLSHAVEYLLHSSLEEGGNVDKAALVLLIQSSRQILAECREIEPFWHWVSKRFLSVS